MSKKKVVVTGRPINILSVNKEDYISLSDMVKGDEEGTQRIINWIRNKNTIEFLSAWERLNNPDNFDEVALTEILLEAGTHRFLMSPGKWIDAVGAIGLISQRGKTGGVYAHKDIAFEFAAWLSPEFKLYLIKEFQRLKDLEAKRLAEGWDTKRELTKVNYRIHTDAVRNHLISGAAGKGAGLIYATEADLLNMVVFGCTAQDFKIKNPKLQGNMRDHASVEELLVLASLETLNALYIEEGKSPEERFQLLSSRAEKLMESVTGSKATERLKNSVAAEAKALQLPESGEEGN